MRKFAYSKIYLHIFTFCVSMSLFTTASNAAPVYTNTEYAESVKLTITSRDSSTILDLFKQIESKSEFVIIYNAKVVDTNSKVKFGTITNGSVEVVLDSALNQTPYVYTIDDRQITISLAKPTKSESQQERQVTGVVVDEKGSSVIGATVLVKGTTVGIITGIEGEFSIKAKASDILVVSFMGYKTVEVSAAQPILNVTMKQDAIMAEEIVVIGYGTMRKSDLTGSVASVTGESIVNRKNTSITASLQGAISGVTVSRSGSTPGGSGSILVRGVTSISGSKPLIIVDGIPTDNIDHINPNDIESLVVLKDAASASIYGSRAAAGVIVVTTKRAKGESISLSYSYEAGFDTPVPQFGIQNSQDYMTSYNELRWNDLGNKVGSEYSVYSKDLIDNYDQHMKDEPNKYYDTNWRELVLKQLAMRETHNVSISGGSKFVKTNASISYDKIEGLLEHQNYDKITVRTNNDFTINDYIGAVVDINYKRSMNGSPNYNPMAFSSYAAPIFGAMYDDGRVAEGKSGTNPWAAHKYGGTNNATYNRIAGKAALNITPFKGLKISTVLAPSFNFNSSKKFSTAIPYYSAEDPNQLLGHIQDKSTTKLQEARTEIMDLTTQVFANYDKTFDENHNLSAMVGYENYYLKSESIGASRDQYLLDNYPYLDLGPLTLRGNSGSAYEQAYRSFFGRVSYNYKRRYLIQANLRYDGSSRFHQDYRWGLFPSVSLGWVASEESFMKGVSSISFMKVRASYGTLGNERIGNYPYQATMAFGNGIFYQGNDIVSAQTAYQAKYAIQDISWETTTSYNIGIDLNMFTNRLRFSGEYYEKITSDMLLPLEIPDYVGFDNPDQNTGIMTTKGFDFDLSWSDKVGEFNYSVGVNLSNFNSKMGDLGGTVFLGSKVKMEGSEFDEWYGYQSDGLFQTAEEVKNSPLLSSNTKPGDVKYKDISGPEGVPDGVISAEYDRVLLGASLPKYMYGVNLSLGWKGVDFGMVLQGIGKHTKSESSISTYNYTNWGVFPLHTVGKNWSVNNTDEQNLNVKYPRLTESNKASNNFVTSDYWLFNGGYLRLKNVTLGYTIPERFTSKLNVRNLRVYVSATDLFSIDNYPDGYDPEADLFGYPIVTTFLGGISITF